MQNIIRFFEKKLFDGRKLPNEQVGYKNLTEGSWQTFEEFKHIYDLYLKPIKPKKIIEIGVAMGGTSRIFLDLVGVDGLVVGIDISKALISSDILAHPNYRFLHGFSSDEQILDQVKAISGSYDAILIDGDHTENGVLNDSSLYIPFIRDGGLVMWHDVRLEPPAGIKMAWYRKLKKSHLGASEYYIDDCNNGIGFWYKTKQTQTELRSLILNQNKENLYEKLYKNCHIYLNCKKNDLEVLAILELACSKLGKKSEEDRIKFQINLLKLWDNKKEKANRTISFVQKSNDPFGKILNYLSEQINNPAKKSSFDVNFHEHAEFLVSEGLVDEARDIYNFLLDRYPENTELQLGSAFLMLDEIIPLEDISSKICSIYEAKNDVCKNSRFVKLANTLINRAERMQQKNLAEKLKEKFICSN